MGLSMSGFRDFFLYDPDKPMDNPDALLRARGGKLTDPRAVNHNCPICNRTMAWDLFQAHARPCYAKWRKVKLDISRKVFKGA